MDERENIQMTLIGETEREEPDDTDVNEID